MMKRLIVAIITIAMLAQNTGAGWINTENAANQYALRPPATLVPEHGLPTKSWQDGPLDGLTILRYHSGAMGGVYYYLQQLDKALFKRSNVTIIQLCCTNKKQDEGVHVRHIGKGRFVNVLVYVPAKKKVAPGIQQYQRFYNIAQTCFERLGITYFILNHLVNSRLSLVLRRMPVVKELYNRRLDEVAIRMKAREILQQKGLFSQYSIDLVMVHNIYLKDGQAVVDEVEAAAAIQKRAIPVVAQHHGVNSYFNNIVFRESMPKLSRTASVTRIGMPSDTQRKNEVLRDGIDTDFFSPALAKTNGLGFDEPVVLLPARINLRKGCLDIIRIVSRVLRNGRIKKVKIIFAGAIEAPMFKKDIEALARKRGIADSIVFAGELAPEEIRDYYCGSDVVVLPSMNEGLPRVLLEAQAMERPVIAYDVGGVSEAINDTVTGYVIKQGDVKGFAERLEGLLLDKAKRVSMGEKGRRFIIDEGFTLPALAVRHEAFYLEVLKSSSAGEPSKHRVEVISPKTFLQSLGIALAICVIAIAIPISIAWSVIGRKGLKRLFSWDKPRAKVWAEDRTEEQVRYLENIVRKKGKDSPEAIIAALKAMESMDERVRKAAKKILSNASPAKMRVAVPEILRLLESSSYRGRMEAAILLGKVGPDAKVAIPALKRVLTDKIIDARASSAWALGEIGGSRARDALVGKGCGINDSSWDVQAHSIIALLKIEGEGALRDITAKGVALNSSDSVKRALLIGSLAEIGDPLAIVAITAEGVGINDSSSYVRGVAVEAIGKIGGPQAFDVLKYIISGVGGFSESVQEEAVLALAGVKFPDKSLSLLSKPGIGINSSEWRIRGAAAKAIGRIGGQRALAVLTTEGVGINDKVAGVREKAAEALGSIGGAKSSHALINTCLKDRSNYVRIAAVIALAQMGGLEATQAIVRALSDSDNHVRQAAVDSTIKMAGPKAIKILTAENIGANDKDSEISRTVIGWLGKIGTPEAVKALAVKMHDKRAGMRVEAALALGKIPRQEVVDLLIAPGIGINDKSDWVAETSASSLSEIFAKQPRILTRGHVLLLMRFIDSYFIRADLEKAFKENPQMLFSLADEAASRIRSSGFIKPEDFNFLIFISLVDSVAIQTRAKYIKFICDLALREGDNRKRMIYLWSAYNAFMHLGKHEREFLDKRYSNIVTRIGGLLKISTPPYKTIFDSKRNPDQKFNIRLYAPLAPELYIAEFAKRGFSGRSKGDVTEFTKVINGKRVTVYFNSSGNPNDYKGEVFRDIGDPNIHMIAYSGHTGMGASLAFALDVAPRLNTLESGEKIISIFSCSSAICYLGEVVKRYPYSHFIGTTTTSWTTCNVLAFFTTIEEITKQKDWPAVKDVVKQKVKKLQLPKGADEPVGYLFPHEDDKFKYFKWGFAAGSHDGMFMPTSGIMRLSDRDAFDFEMGNIEVSRIRSTKPMDAVKKIAYFFHWNTFLKDMHDRLVPGGFDISYTDEQDACFVSRTKDDNKKTAYKVSINAGYGNSSEAVLVMMGLYELNLYFSKMKKGEIDIYDKLRGLVLVAEFVKHYHKEHLFEHFLKKYGYEQIPLNELLDTLDTHSDAHRIKALQKLLRRLNPGQTEEADGAKLKHQGLLSYMPQPLSPGGIDDEFRMALMRPNLSSPLVLGTIRRSLGMAPLSQTLMQRSTAEEGSARPFLAKTSSGGGDKAAEAGSGLPQHNPGPVDYADIAFTLIEKYQIYSDAIGDTRKSLIEFLRPYFLQSGLGDFKEFLEKVYAALKEKLPSEELPSQARAGKITLRLLRHIVDVVLYQVDRDELGTAAADRKSTFLEEFHKTHLFISASELDLKKGETIYIKDMLVRYARAFPDKLGDPEGVLVLIRERDGTIIFKNLFSGEDRYKVSANESFWVVYRYPSLKALDRTTPPEDIFVKLGDMTPQQQEEIAYKLQGLGRDLVSQRPAPAGLVKSWLKPGKGKRLSNLELAKRLMLYYHKPTDRLSREEEGAGLKFLMNYLMQDNEVRSWVLKVVERMYSNGYHIETKLWRMSGYEYRKEFMFLLTLLVENIGSLDEKQRDDILSIAVHTFIQMVAYSSIFERPKGLIRAMAGTDMPAVKQAVFLKFITGLNVETVDTEGRGTERLRGFFNENDYQTVSRFLLQEFLRYVIYITPHNIIGRHMGVDHLNLQLAKTLFLLGERAIYDLLDLIMREDDLLLQNKMIFFLEETSNAHCAQGFRGVEKRWIDMLIDLAQKNRLELRSICWSSKIIRKYPEYRREEFEPLLISMLEDPSREDIPNIIGLLRIYRSTKAHDAVIRSCLTEDSEFSGCAIDFVTDLADPAYFDRVWQFASGRLNGTGKTENSDVEKFGSYCVAILSQARDRLSPAQRSAIEQFAETHLFSRDLEGLMRDNDDFHAKDIAKNWILLSGLLGRGDKLAEVRKVTEWALKQENEYLKSILQAFLYSSSDESYDYLVTLCAKIMGFGYGEKDQLYSFLRTPVAGMDRMRKRRLFADLIDIAVDNEMRPEFSELAHIFIFADTAGALDILRSGRVNGVDLSDIDLYCPIPIDRPSYYPDTEKAFLPREVRNLFLEWFLRHLKSPDSVSRLRLIDDSSKFNERAREKLRLILFEDLGLKEDDIKEKFEGVEFTPIFALILWQERAEEQDQMHCLYLLKPIIDICSLEAEVAPDTPDLKAFIWERLKERDPAFYLPLKEQIGAYLDWLIKNKALTEKPYLALDRFASLFITKKTAAKAVKRSDVSLLFENVKEFMRFALENMLPALHPEGMEKRGFYNFERTFLRTLVTLWVRDVLKRTYDGRPVQLMLPIFKTPPKPRPDTAPKGPVAFVAKRARTEQLIASAA